MYFFDYVYVIFVFFFCEYYSIVHCFCAFLDSFHIFLSPGRRCYILWSTKIDIVLIYSTWYFFSRIIIIQVREDVQSSTLRTRMDVLFVCLQSQVEWDCSSIHEMCVSFVCYHPILVCVCVLSRVFFSPCFLPSTPYYTIFFCVRFLVHYCFLFSEYLKCLLTLRAYLLVLRGESGRVCCIEYNE